MVAISEGVLERVAACCISGKDSVVVISLGVRVRVGVVVAADFEVVVLLVVVVLSVAEFVVPFVLVAAESESVVVSLVSLLGSSFSAEPLATYMALL